MLKFPPNIPDIGQRRHRRWHWVYHMLCILFVQGYSAKSPVCKLSENKNYISKSCKQTLFEGLASG